MTNVLKNLIVVPTFLFLFSCETKTAVDYYNLAFELEENGEYAKAIPYLDKAIEKKPNFRPALLNRGADKSELEDYEGAISDYQKIIDFDPDNTLALLNIGNNYKRLKQYEKSIEYYSKALRTKGAIKSDSVTLIITPPNSWDNDSDYYIRNFEIEYERGISYVYTKNYKLAIDDLENALNYIEDFPNAMSWLGEAYYYLNDTINARKYLSKAFNYGMIDAENLLKKLNSEE